MFMFPVLHPSNRELTRNDSPLCFAMVLGRFSRASCGGGKCGLGFAGGGCWGYVPQACNFTHTVALSVAMPTTFCRWMLGSVSGLKLLCVCVRAYVLCVHFHRLIMSCFATMAGAVAHLGTHK